MPRISFLLSTLAISLAVVLLSHAPILGQETKTIWVAHHRVDCVGVTPQKCYLIKDTQYEDWRFWYGEIAGFEFEDGYAYELLVVERPMEDSPADAASSRLELVKVVLKVETFETPDPEPSPPAAVAVEPDTPEAEPLPPVAVAEPEPAPAGPQPEPVEPPRSAPSLPEPSVPPPSSMPAPPILETAPPPRAPAASVPTRQLPTSESTQVLRGHLMIGAGIEARSFKLCGAEEGIWVEDRTEDDLWSLYRRLSSYPNRPVFMEVEGDLAAAPPGGFGSHFQQQILIRHVRQASVESAGCFADSDPVAFRASGNEPFWNVEISKRGLSFSELGQDGKILFPYSPPTFFAEQIIYRSQIRGQSLRSLVVRLVERPCNDSMADATFSFSAEVKIDDRELTGCAVRGDAEP